MAHTLKLDSPPKLPVFTGKPTFSLAMIVKNEQETIERVLACASQVCEELIVVDTGSTDRTVELAQKAGARVIPFQWINDFAAARNHAFANCSGDWILWLDADDILTDVDQVRIRALKDELNDDHDAVFINYQIAFGVGGQCTFSTLRERLIRRQAGLLWEYPIHECIAVPAGRFLERPDLAVQHRTLPSKQADKVSRNLDILQATVQSGDRRPRNLFYLANELKDHSRFGDAIPVYREYLTVSNLHWEKYWATLSLARCYQQLGEPEKARHAALEAVILDSQRAEAYIQLGIHCYDRRQWSQAIPYFQIAARLEAPAQGFTDNDAYSWQPHDYLSVCYANLGLYPEAIKTTLDALSQNPHKSRLLSNLHWMVDQL
jgi:glycosyltransferase involved in cell wall biosynthesis